MTDRRKRPVRATHSFRETLEIEREGARTTIKRTTSRYLNQGVTEFGIASFPSWDTIWAAMDEYGFDPEWVKSWPRLRSKAQMMDAFATWLLLADQAMQPQTYRLRSDIMGQTRIQNVLQREMVMTPDVVQWVLEELGHTSAVWGRASPALHNGSNRTLSIQERMRDEADREAERAAHEERAIVHRRIDDAIERKKILSSSSCS